MDSTPVISVIVPVYNCEAFLSRCVDSLLNQTYDQLEIILVDDGSRDGSLALCREYQTRDSRIQVLAKENGGASTARNAGLDIARGEYIAFVDSDDWLELDAYEKLMAMALAEQVKLVCCGRYDVDGSTGSRTLGLCPVRREVISGQEAARRVFLWDNLDSAPWDKLYHASLFQQLRFQPGVIAEDMLVVYKVALMTDRVGLVDLPLCNYYHREGSVTSSVISAKSFHFSRHTAVIYQDIREHYPQLEREARYLRVRSLGYTLQLLDGADPQTRAAFADSWKPLRPQLRSHLPFLLTSPLFTRKERLSWLLAAFDLYRPLRALRHGTGN